MAKTSPTQRALKECRKRGWTCQVVEHWNQWAKIRQDLFGAIDILAITEDSVLGIQVTSAANHAARREKALSLPAIQDFMRVAQFAVWSYGMKGPRGQKKVMTLREEILSDTQ